MINNLYRGKVLFWVVFLFSCTLLTHGKNSGQGDEPHYMIIAHSLWFDHDLALINDYEEPGNIIYDGNLKADTHVREGTNGQWYSKHAFGLPLLSLPVFGPAYYISDSLSDEFLKKLHVTRWTLLRLFLSLAMALVTARLAVLVFDEVILTTKMDRKIAWLAVAACFLSCPLLPLGFLFFTEMPAAFLAFFAYSTPAESKHPAFDLAKRTLALSYLPFLHVKYTMLGFALFLVLLIRLYTTNRRISLFATLIAISALGQLALALTNYFMWGSILPYSSFGEWLLSARAYITGVLGLFLDQEFGLLAFSPIYALAFAGWILYFKENWRKCAELTFLILSVLGVVCALPMWWGGWSPAARFLTPVAVFLIPLVAVAIQKLWEKRFAGWFVKGLLALQTIIAIRLWLRPRLMWNLADGWSEFHGILDEVIPSVIKFSPMDRMQAVVWTIAIAVLTAVLVWSATRIGPTESRTG